MSAASGLEPRKIAMLVVWLFGPIFQFSGAPQPVVFSVLLAVSAVLTIWLMWREPSILALRAQRPLLGSAVAVSGPVLIYGLTWLVLHPAPARQVPTAQEIADAVARTIPTTVPAVPRPEFSFLSAGVETLQGHDDPYQLTIDLKNNGHSIAKDLVAIAVYCDQDAPATARRLVFRASNQYGPSDPFTFFMRGIYLGKNVNPMYMVFSLTYRDDSGHSYNQRWYLKWLGRSRGQMDPALWDVTTEERDFLTQNIPARLFLAP